MGIINMSDLEKYWNTNTNTKIPFFGKYMSCNKFQSILWNLHVVDDSNNPTFGNLGHNPLAKLGPFITMIDRNFLHVYCPSQQIAFDEACCPFKGQLCFCCFNPAKPNQFHIKLYQACEYESGYIIGFDIYTGKGTSCISNNSNPLDPECTKMTKLVLGLLQKLELLDKGYHI